MVSQKAPDKTPMETPNKVQNKVLNGTGFVRAGAWVAIFWERLWPLLVPLVLVAIVFFSLSWLGIWQYLPVWLHVAVLLAFLAALVAALMPLRTLLAPTAFEVTRRIEIETDLADRPISAQVDQIALGEADEFSRALWNAHRERMAKRLDNLVSGTPNARGDRFDPYGLRLMLPVLAFVAFVISYGSDGGSVAQAFRLGGDPAKLLTRLDVWVNPPDYTNKAPVYLSVDGSHQKGQSLLLPQHSQLIGRFTGGGRLSMWFKAGPIDASGSVGGDDDNGRGVEIKHIEADSDNTLIQTGVSLALNKSGNPLQERKFLYKLTRSGVVSVYSGITRIAGWSLDIVADSPPRISFVKQPSASLSGALQLSYAMEDDYGVADATGLVELPEPENDDGKYVNRELAARFIPPADARPLIEPLKIKLSLPRRRTRSGSAKVNRDVSKHPLAGTLVKLRLVARDDSDQEGYSETREIILPGRNFSDPVAKALIEQRRILALDANQKDFVAAMLDAVTTAPEKFNDDFATFMSIKIARRRLIDAGNDDELRGVIDLLWDVALGIEFGNMSAVEQRLREAQERLSEALENDASDKEIDKLMRELRQAMNELMQALAEQARQNPQLRNPMFQNDNARMLRQRDLERMLNRIEDLAKSGSKDAARQLLSEMQRMMDNLRAGRHMQQRRAEGNQMNQTLDKLGELMQRQQSLMDETFRMEQRRSQNRNNSEDQDDQSPNMTAREFADAMKQLRDQQGKLQQQLDALNKKLEELGLGRSENFDEAGKQMGKAGNRLGEGQPGDAAGNQGQALEALKRGARSIMRQMAGDRQQGGQQQGQGRSGTDRRLSRDPLGRGQRNNGTEFDNNTEIPGEIDAQRARRVLEAIRKRLSLPDGPLIEKDYLERLLKSR